MEHVERQLVRQTSYDTDAGDEKGAGADDTVLSLVAQHHVDRWYLERGCKRIEVHSPCGVRGTLFIPASISNGEGETYASTQPEREQQWLKKRGESLIQQTSRQGRRARGVVDMFGTAGGLLEFRAALLASHGFVALALAFFDFQDLPKAMHGITVEYFLVRPPQTSLFCLQSATRNC